MSNEVAKKDLTDLADGGWAGWTDGVAGDDRPQSAGIIKGVKIKFVDAIWRRRDNTEMPDIELIPAYILRVIQTWGQENRPIEEETKFLAADEKFPDFEAINAAIPHEDWVDGPTGDLVGPVQGSHVVYFIHLATMDQYTFIAPTTTIGSVRATADLRAKIIWMRRVKCPPGTPQNVYPTIKLSKTWMPTKYAGGGRWRPHFEILPDRWVRFGGESSTTALPSPETPAVTAKEQLDKFAKSPAQPITAEPKIPLTTVKEPTLKEELNDEIPDFPKPKLKAANEPEKAPASRPTARRDLKKQSSVAKTAARSTSRKRLTNMDAG
jgi:hypothetical protein